MFLDHGSAIVELIQEVDIQVLDEGSTVMPHGVVGRVQLKSLPSGRQGKILVNNLGPDLSTID